MTGEAGLDPVPVGKAEAGGVADDADDDEELKAANLAATIGDKALFVGLVERGLSSLSPTLPCSTSTWSVGTAVAVAAAAPESGCIPRPIVLCDPVKAFG